jgi:hypothetical protein
VLGRLEGADKKTERCVKTTDLKPLTRLERE